MFVNVDELHSAIRDRHSTRTYTSSRVDGALLETLQRQCDELSNGPRGARVKVVHEHAEKVMSGLAIRGVTSFLVMIGDNTQPQVEEAVGYVGEYAILASTVMGLATCWVSGTYKPAEAAKYADLGPSEKVYSVSPLGYAGTPGVVDNFFKWAAKSRTRKPMEEILTPDSLTKDYWPSWVAEALECARVAPSAANKQPWLFSVKPDAVRISTNPAVRQLGAATKRLDCGIAMLHLELGALAAGADVHWEFLDEQAVATLRAV